MNTLAKGFALAAVFVIAAPGVVPAAPGAAPTTLAGLTLTDARGERYAESAPAGRVTVVGFWATWCPSCRTELPELIALGEDLAAEGIDLLLVSVDRVPEKAARYLERLDYQGRAAYDPGARSASDHGITGIPTVLLVDGGGIERARIVGSGMENLERVRDHARTLLASEVD
jgi:thiol-disulfide isomerase/thioredoxin